jgi:hypothetical protein
MQQNALLTTSTVATKPAQQAVSCDLLNFAATDDRQCQDESNNDDEDDDWFAILISNALELVALA